MSDTVLWYATRGAGVVSILLLTAVFVLGILSVRRYEAAGWPRFLTTGLHRNLSLVAVIFLGLHIVAAVVDPFTHLGWTAAIVPFSSYYRTFWLGLGAVAVELMAAVLLSSLARGFIGQASWRALHWLAYACWPIAAVHGWGTGTDSGSGWVLAIDAVCVLAVVIAVLARLLGRPADPLAANRERFRQEVRRESVR
jgi:methionine sulfoxide reductase heme-binding subunit